MFKNEFVVGIIFFFFFLLGSGLISRPRDVAPPTGMSQAVEPRKRAPSASVGNQHRACSLTPADRRPAGDFFRVGPLRDAPRLRLLRTENRNREAFVHSHSEDLRCSDVLSPGSAIHQTPPHPYGANRAYTPPYNQRQ